MKIGFSKGGGITMCRKIDKEDIKFCNCLPTPILIFNRQNKVVFANYEAIKLYGYDSEEFKDIYISNLKAQGKEMQVENSVMKYFFDDKKNHRILSQHKTKEGKIIDVDIQTTILEINNENFLLECIRENTEQQDVLRTYERAVDIMSKVVKGLTDME